MVESTLSKIREKNITFLIFANQQVGEYIFPEVGLPNIISAVDLWIYMEIYGSKNPLQIHSHS